jgi:hypothetical protein
MKIILTGTRAPATLDLARRLSHEGAEVIGVDSLRWPVGRFSKAFRSHHHLPPARQDTAGFVEALARLAEEEKADLLWPTCEEIFYIGKHWQTLQQSVRLLCEPLTKLLPLHHKLDFAHYTQRLGQAVQAPASWSADAAPKDRPLVWKPYFSRFATRTRLHGPPPNVEGWLAQERVFGNEFCCWALCVNGSVNLLTFYRGTARAGQGACCAFEPTSSEPAAAFVRAVAADLSFTGSLAFDFMEEPSGRVSVLECNPRLTSGIHVLDPSVSILSALHRPVPAPQRAAQLYLPTLLTNFRVAGTTPDVVSLPRDRSPAWGQFLGLAELLARSLRRSISPLHATTWDIEFNG